MYMYHNKNTEQIFIQNVHHGDIFYPGFSQTFTHFPVNDSSLKCLLPNFFHLINEKYSLQIVELSKHIFV